MKRIDTQGITYLQPLDGTDQWYYSIDFPDGDMYEAEELHAMGREITGTRLLLIHYPDGEIIEPIKRKKIPICTRWMKSGYKSVKSI